MKNVKYVLISVIIASFLVACGGSGSGSGDKSTPTTSTDNGSSEKSPSQDIQEKLSYVNGDYEVRGTITSSILGQKTTPREFKDTFKYRLKGNVLEGHPLWEGRFFVEKFSQILSDTRGKLTLHSDGSYSGKRVIRGYDKKPGKLMEVIVNENGTFTKTSVNGRMLMVMKYPNLNGIGGTIEYSYYSINKIPLYPQAKPTPQPAQEPKPQPQNIQSGLQNECQKIGGTLVPLVIDKTHSYTCSFGNNRPSSFTGFKSVCENYGLTFKDASISFMCVGELP